MCEIKNRLQRQLAESQTEWRKSFAALSAQTGFSSHDSAALQHLVKVAKLEAERVRHELKAHLNRHRC